MSLNINTKYPWKVSDKTSESSYVTIPEDSPEEVPEVRKTTTSHEASYATAVDASFAVSVPENVTTGPSDFVDGQETESSASSVRNDTVRRRKDSLGRDMPGLGEQTRLENEAIDNLQHTIDAAEKETNQRKRLTSVQNHKSHKNISNHFNRPQ